MDEGYPIAIALIIVNVFKIVKIVATIFALAYFFGIIWYIIIKDLIAWDNVTNIDVFNEQVAFYTYEAY